MARAQAKGRTTATKRPKTKKRTTKRTSKKSSSTSKSSKRVERIDQLVAAQKATINDVSEFVGNVATLTANGDFAPKTWADQYKKLLRGLSDNLADATKALLKD